MCISLASPRGEPPDRSEIISYDGEYRVCQLIMQTLDFSPSQAKLIRDAKFAEYLEIEGKSLHRKM